MTVIAAGFDRVEGAPAKPDANDRTAAMSRRALGLVDTEVELAGAGLSFGDEDDFDVPPFLK